MLKENLELAYNLFVCVDYRTMIIAIATGLLVPLFDSPRQREHQNLSQRVST
jgi:hypothetical protein